jgi:hypothetical protein
VLYGVRSKEEGFATRPSYQGVSIEKKEILMAGFFEGLLEKGAATLGGWEGGGGYVTPGGSSGEYASRTGKQDNPNFGALDSIAAMWRGPDAARIAANAPVRPGSLVGEDDLLRGDATPAGRPYVEPRSENLFSPVQKKLVHQPLRKDIGAEGLPSSTQLAMGIKNQRDADLVASAFRHVPVEQIPEDYVFDRPFQQASTPRELRSRLRGMTEAELVESLFGDRTAVDRNTAFGASGTGWGGTARQRGTGFNDLAQMNPSWSVGVQHLEDRLAGGGATREGKRIFPEDSYERTLLALAGNRKKY